MAIISSQAAFVCVFVPFLAAVCGGHVAPPADVPQSVLQDLETALGPERRAMTESRLGALEESLHPLYSAMPKSSDGSLGPLAIRYMLNRIFIEKHAWHVIGLDKNSTSPTRILGDRVSEKVQQIFDKRIETRSFGLHELAVLASTLELLVLDEAMDKLSNAYRVAGLGLKIQRASEDEFYKVLETYMMLYIGRLNHSAVTLQGMIAQEQRILLDYPTWPDTQKFVRDVIVDVIANHDGRGAKRFLTFADATQVVEAIGSRYGRWQDSECKDLRKSLLKVEHGDSGRVLVKDFYGSALAGQWQFSESVPYLSEIGALDTSGNPQYPSVVVANYLNSASNCVASSSFYAVCCLDECEPLLAHLERRIVAPEATPDRIIQLVEALPSATVDAPRHLSTALRGRLGAIAGQHGGRVPLHGRLFAQWMHHAYPRECAFPELTAANANENEYKKASKTEMQRHADLPRPAVVADLPWYDEEELYIVASPEEADAFRHIWAASRPIFFFIALASLGMSLWRSSLNAIGSMASAFPLLGFRLPGQPSTLAGKRIKELASRRKSETSIKGTPATKTGSIKSVQLASPEIDLDADGVLLPCEETRNSSCADRAVPASTEEQDDGANRLLELEKQLKAARENEAFYRQHAAEAAKTLSEKSSVVHKALKRCDAPDLTQSWTCPSCSNLNPVAGHRCIKCGMTSRQAKSVRQHVEKSETSVKRRAGK